MENYPVAQNAQSAGGLVPLAEIERAAAYIAGSGLFGVKTKEQACALMLVAQSENMHYARAAMAYDVIQGRPALKSSEVLSRFQNAGGRIKYERTDDAACVVELFHPAGGEMKVKWDIERAKKAGLSMKDNWVKFPAAMLRARAVSEGVRALFPACLSGFYAVEEAQDFDPPQPSPKALEPLAAPKEPEARDAEVVPSTLAAAEPPKPDFSVNIGGAEPPPEPPWVSLFMEWIKTLPDQSKVKQVTGKYCPWNRQKLAALSRKQAGQLIQELSAVFNAFVSAELCEAVEVF